MKQGKPLKRRAFLRATALAGGGLLVACNWSSSSSSSNTGAAGGGGGGAGDTEKPTPDPNAESWMPNIFIRISEDNFVTVIVAASEIGQGTMTAIPMILAEELDADWQRVSWEQSDAATVPYGNPFWQRSANDITDELGLLIDQGGLQITAASTTVRGYFNSYRTAGAALREMLVTAAAEQLNVDASTLRTENSYVVHTSGARLSYGELAAAAAEVTPPTDPVLKEVSQFSLIGQRKQRLDGAAKSDGSQQYGMDVIIPDMLTVVVQRAPVFGALVQSYDDSETLSVPGVVGTYQVPSGVAVAATDFWAAEQGRKKLQVTWNTLLGETSSSEELLAQYRQLLELPGRVALDTQDPLSALTTLGSTPTHTADFDFPYLAHAPMEPLNVTIDYRGSECEIWCGSQWPDMDKLVASLILGLPPTAVKFNTLLSGGGFGRRACLGFDYIQEAAHVARTIGAPLKVVWTREDDIHGGYYRPLSACKLSASLDGAGNITSWTHRVARQVLLVSPLAETATAVVTEEVQSHQGAVEIPYDIPNVRVETHNPQNGVPVLWMRSVANAVNVYAVETFFDELAKDAGKDPLAMRRELLQNNPRQLAVLDAAASLAGWNTPPAAGVYRGIATCTSYDSYIAQVVEASIDAERKVTIHRVVSAVDCGVAVNPDLVEAQIESAVVFALSSALFGEITLEEGVVQQSNFHDYPMLRMYQTPEMETVILPSEEHPGGVGELGVPCVAPALVNALFAATGGETFRSLPLKNHNLVFA